MKVIYVTQSNIVGKGLFAGESINAGEIVFVMTGEVIEISINSYEEAMVDPDIMGIGKNTWIAPPPPFIYINHSCRPNTGIKGELTFVALRNINKNEELTFDYSISEESPWEMECKCGEPNCRRVIRSIQFLPEDVFNKLLPFIPEYFQKVYREYHNAPKLGRE